MPETKVVLLEQDDLMHPNTGESNFNERQVQIHADHYQSHTQ